MDCFWEKDGWRGGTIGGRGILRGKEMVCGRGITFSEVKRNLTITLYCLVTNGEVRTF